MNKKRNVIATMLFAIFAFISLYYILVPVFLDFHSAVKPRHLFNLDDARNYYTALGSVIGSIIGISGVVLGFFYYFHRLNNDSSIARQEHRKRRLDVLLLEIYRYDSYVNKIVNLCIRDELDLKETRASIDRSYEYLLSILECQKDLLGFKDGEIRMILRVHSFVEQCPMIMNAHFEEFDYDKMYLNKDRYLELMRNALRICHSSLDSVEHPQKKKSRKNKVISFFKRNSKK